MPEKNRTPMDDVFDTLLRAAASRAANEMFDEIDASIPDEDIHFSENHIKAMNNILYGSYVDLGNNDLKHFKLKRRYILAAIVTMTFLISTAVCADRLKFLDYFMNKSSVNTSFTKSPDTEEGTYFVDESLKENLSETDEYQYSVKLNYIPDGFTLTDSDKGMSGADYRYSCNEKYFDVGKSIIPDTFDIDTENAETQYININGCEAFISIKTQITILFWTNNDILYTVLGNIDKDAIIKIAENME